MKARLLAAIMLFAASFGLYAAAADDPFIVHEWGTFTSVQGADGVQLTWTASIGTDLPDFVYSRDTHNGGIRGAALLDTSSKTRTPSFVRMYAGHCCEQIDPGS